MAESKVTSVGLKGPDGFDIINSPITSRGNLEFAFSRGFTLPSISRQTSWDRAYADSHRHINKIILDEITEEHMDNWDIALEHTHIQGNPHNLAFKDILKRPNTLGGYGIIDAYTKSEITHIINSMLPSNGGNDITILTSDSWANETDSNIYSALRTRKELDNLRKLINSSGGSSNHTHPNKTIIDSFTQEHLDILALFSIDSGNLKVGTNMFSIGEISAYGLGEGSGGGGGGGSLVVWGTENNGTIPLTVEGISKTIALKSGLELKQDKLIAGTGINIVGNTISSTAIGGVTSVGLTAPTGFTISNSPITSSGNLALTFASGYSLPTTVKQNNWDTAYTHSQSEHQSIINGTGFVKANGKTLSYDNSSYSLSSHNHSGIYQPLHTGLTNIATQSASVITGLLRKTAANTWTFDTNTYSLSNHTHTFASLTNKPTTISGYGITNGALTTTSIIAGDGLSGGGTLAGDRTITLGTPSNITVSTGNSVTATSHTHSLALGGTASQYLNGATALVTIPTITAGNGLTGGGQLTSGRTLTLATPSTLTAATTNGVTASSHTHAITTTSIGVANTIVQTDATGGTKLNNLMVGGAWKIEQTGTELLLKYNNSTAARFLSDGSIVGLGEITAYGTSTGGEGVALLRTGGTMAGAIRWDTQSSNTPFIGRPTNDAASFMIALNGTTWQDGLTLGGASGNLLWKGSQVLDKANTANKIEMGNGWTIEQTSASLTIRKNGVVKGTFNA